MSAHVQKRYRHIYTHCETLVHNHELASLEIIIMFLFFCLGYVWVGYFTFHFSFYFQLVCHVHVHVHVCTYMYIHCMSIILEQTHSATHCLNSHINVLSTGVLGKWTLYKVI